MINTILESFDIWTRSQTIKSNGRTAGVDNQRLLGIDKLRELILELAVRGKLVPQDEKDESAKEFLKKIQKLKSKIKQENSEEILDEEKFFDLPKGWQWCRLSGLISILGDGIHGTPNYSDGDYFFINGNNLKNGKIDINNAKRVDNIEFLKHRKELNSSTVLVSINGTIGNIAFYNGEKVILGKSACYFNLLEESMKHYLRMLLNSRYFLDYALLNATGTTIKNVSLKTMRNFVVPLPPLAEQRRIVSKVAELMALCDQLEQQQTENNTTHHQLVELLLQNLNAASGPEAFAIAWQRIATNFDTLFTTEYSIDQLKQTILQLAVMGKLVPQDPKDEPASELLKKIAKEKERLVKEGKIKKQEKLPEITEEEKPFELPRGWEWTKCLEICLKITDGEHATPIRSSSGYYLLSARNVTNEGIILDDVDFVPLDEFERIRKRCDPNIGDILISCSGSVGRVALVDKDNAYSMVRSAAMIRPEPNFLMKEYLVYLIRSPFLQFQIIKKSRQTAQANIFLGSISNLVFTIPPLAEQHRIVVKADELFALCDALKKRIKEAQETQGKLAECMVGGVLS